MSVQRILSVLLAILLPSLAWAGNYRDITLPGGNMRFQGLIIAESCRVETGGLQMTVNMGRVSSNRFQSVGQDINPIPFDINLQDCSSYVGRNVGIVFHGVAHSRNPEVLSIGMEKDAAVGVGIALFDKENSLVPLNGNPQFSGTLKDGVFTFHFVAKYRAVEYPVSGGVVNAQAWFTLIYQ